MDYQLRTQWEQATGELPYGVQRVFRDVLNLVAEGKKKDLVYGTDYTDKGACLVNASANMLTTGGGHGIPVRHFNEVVRLFDQINGMLEEKDVNTEPNKVSPLAAEILVMWFAPLRDVPEPKEEVPVENVISLPYDLPSDAEMEEAFLTLLSARPVATPWDDVEALDETHEELWLVPDAQSTQE
jgi:hypothetical protein